MSTPSVDQRKNDFHSVNPTTGEVVESFEVMSDAEVRDLVTKAATGYSFWETKTPTERGTVIERVGKLFLERAEELAKIAAEEMGKPLSQGIGEVEFSGQIFQYYRKNGPDFIKDEPVEDTKGGDPALKLPVLSSCTICRSKFGLRQYHAVEAL